tara:strand:- start:982 stop:1284 length:303 start_codon:yes stop_codon:yes gene_type:complete
MIDEESDHTYLLAFTASDHASFAEWDEVFQMKTMISPNNKDDKATKEYFLGLFHLLHHCVYLLKNDEEFCDFVQEDLDIKEKLERGSNVINLFTPTKGSA